MKSLKQQRAILRRDITLLHAKHYENNSEYATAAHSKVVDKGTRLFELDAKILDSEEDQDTNFEEMEIYREKYLELISLESPVKQRESHRTVRLPEIKLPKFDGEAGNWITFWSQFQKIDSDNLSEEDKFHYLSNCMEGKAKKLIDSYPMSGINYKKALTCLKNRFANDSVLVDYYVRKLHYIMISEITNTENRSLAQLFDEINCNINNLASLDIPPKTYCPFLQPLIESTLPTNVLKAWERSKGNSHFLPTNSVSGDEEENVVDLCTNFNNLMKFIQQEVDSEEKIKRAKSAVPSSDYKSSEPIVTASGLLNQGKILSVTCIFCARPHNSQDCIKYQKITLNEKKKIVSDKKGCFICLKVGHRAKQCKAFVKCIICQRRHHAIMCNEEITKKRDSPHNNTDTLYNKGGGKVYLQTLKVNIVDAVGNMLYNARCLLDSGSQCSYILKDLASKFNLTDDGNTQMIHNLFGGVQSKYSHKRFQVFLQSMDQKYQTNLVLLGQEKICNAVPRLVTAPKIEYNNSAIKFSDVGAGTPDVELLLGADSIAKISTGNFIRISDTLIAIETKLGWSIMGSDSTLTSLNIATSTLNLNNVSDFWSLEILGINEPMAILEDEQNILEFFHETISKDENNRYQVKLPWKRADVLPTCNKTLAENRLNSVMRKLKSLNKVQEYNDIFNQWLKEGIIEEVDPDEISKSDYYLPHHPVFKNSSTTSIRPVFDGTAHLKGGLSINDCLMKGPNLLQLIPKLLTCFRMHRFAVSADIKQAFLQIGVDPSDRNMLKFLWDGDKVFRHARVVFGIVSSPFLLQATLNFHLSKFGKQGEYFKDKFYVDNYLDSTSTEQGLINIICSLHEMMIQGKFELRKWCFNSKQTTQTLLKRVNVEYENRKEISVLGLIWDSFQDVLSCEYIPPRICNTKMITKRFVLSMTNKLFDPVGVTAPVSLLPKLILKETWELKLPWDQELPIKLKNKFRNWLEELHLINDCKFARWLNYLHGGNNSIHVFCDSSSTAYASCIFLKTEHEGKVSVQLVIAKSRICPSKGTTIPRLELLACLIGARLYNSIKEQMPNKIPVTFWTDSMVALAWIQKSERWKPFVNNRVREILNLTEKHQWKHVPGEHNPADLLSRGCSPKQLLESKWWVGPNWLYQHQIKWQNNKTESDENIVMQEAVSSMAVSSTILVDENSFIENILYKFSSFKKGVRILAYVFRFINMMKKGNQPKFKKSLSVQEFEYAENYVFKIIQKQLHIDNKLLGGLKTFIDENHLIKVSTKLLLGDFPELFQTPVVLPGKHPLVKVLITEHHNEKHTGATLLRTQLREKYFIINSKNVVRSIVNKCTICRRFSAKKADVPFAPLPAERVNLKAAFETTGLDLGGHLFLKNGEKVWFVLFTCSVYRAIHLELVQTLSTESLLMAIRRFMARRGRVKKFWSDNGTNMVGANNLLKTVDWNKIQEATLCEKIKWKFNPPASPWYGGFWERLIGLVKDTLKRNLGRASLTYEELYTVMCDAENTINSRPLTYLYEDNEVPRPITPSLFIQDLPGNNGAPDIDQIDEKSLNLRVKYIQSLREALKQRFRKEYLANLVQYGKRKVCDLKVGDVVIVELENKKKLLWPLGKIIELYEGADKQCRVAKIKVNDHCIVRPLQRLIPLEVSSSIQSNAAVVKTFDDAAPMSPPTDHPLPILDHKLTSKGRKIVKPDKLNL